MTKELTGISCEEFATVLASKTPVPGGGGAAALTGALGVALCSMVGNYTSGKKKYLPVQDDIERILLECESLRERLLQLIDEDARAFEPLSKAYSISKDDPNREVVLEEATKNACKAPIDMVMCCCRAVELLEEILEKGSRLLISDVGCGALLCKAAMECAAMNVFVNTGTLQDQDFVEKTEGLVNKQLAEFVPRATAISEQVTKIIRK